MNEKRSKYRSLLLMVILLVGLAACQNEEPAAEPTAAGETAAAPSVLEDTNTRAINTGFGTVTAEGEVKPLRSAALSFQMGGNVAEILTREGAQVKEGEALMRLDALPLENAVRQAEAGRAAAEASLQAAEARLAVAESGVARAEAGQKAAVAQKALVEAGATPEEIAAAEKNLAAAEAGIVTATGNQASAVRVSDAQVQAAVANLTAVQAEVEQLQQFYDEDIIDFCFDTPKGEICPLYGAVEEQTRFQLEALKANLAAAEAAVEEARAGATPAEAYLASTGVSAAAAQRDLVQAQLDLTLAGAREEQIQQAQVGVDQANVGIQQAQVQVALAESAVTQAEAALVKAEADVESANKALERMTLLAPFDGRVGSINSEIGELVGPGFPVLQLGDVSGWQVETNDLTELDVVGVKLGLPAEVRIDALPGEVVNGVVTDIAAVSQLIRGDVTYPVTITLEETDLPLRWGMTATVDIDTES